MRNTLRLLAVVKPGRYLEAGNPTGLTGLFTHPAPRSALLLLYGATLDKLKALPDHSVYRQSAEALTKHRMKIIESIKPEGYDEWEERAATKMIKAPKIIENNKKIEKLLKALETGGIHTVESVGGRGFVTAEKNEEAESADVTHSRQARAAEMAEKNEEAESADVTRRRQAIAAEIVNMKAGYGRKYAFAVTREPEPPLEASQISDAETRIGGGLIEEVIEVAEGELKLVETIAESQVWEELEEKPPQGQWEYFARDQHTKGTQEPPNK